MKNWVAGGIASDINDYNAKIQTKKDLEIHAMKTFEIHAKKIFPKKDAKI